jgi:hypothetical protein
MEYSIFTIDKNENNENNENKNNDDDENKSTHSFFHRISVKKAFKTR